MCIAIPMKVVEIKTEDTAVCEREGVRQDVDLSLVGEVLLGNHVLVAQGRAVRVVRPEEAEQVERALRAAALVAAGKATPEVIREGFPDLVDRGEPELPEHLRAQVGKRFVRN